MSKPPVLMIIASVLAGLGIIQMTFLIGQSLYRSYEWTREIRVLRGEVHQLRLDLRTLGDVETRAATPDYLRELARCQGFVGSEEDVVVDERATTAAQGNCQPVRLP
ncbi:hypothetical protein [Deinococcus pimensis]|uniref:hypothetical protein n=1 Tax=Deinococcus pimensis TaxID=309888 RepID=UPI000482E9DC|nr:hypothetical protein [Deinococcus pimensis]